MIPFHRGRKCNYGRGSRSRIAIVIAVVLSACALVWDDDDDVQECLSFWQVFLLWRGANDRYGVR